MCRNFWNHNTQFIGKPANRLRTQKDIKGIGLLLPVNAASKQHYVRYLPSARLLLVCRLAAVDMGFSSWASGWRSIFSSSSLCCDDTTIPTSICSKAAEFTYPTCSWSMCKCDLCFCSDAHRLELHRHPYKQPGPCQALLFRSSESFCSKRHKPKAHVAKAPGEGREALKQSV